jgi:hypothetical protein
VRELIFYPFFLWFFCFIFAKVDHISWSWRFCDRWFVFLFFISNEEMISLMNYLWACCRFGTKRCCKNTGRIIYYFNETIVTECVGAGTDQQFNTGWVWKCPRSICITLTNNIQMATSAAPEARRDDLGSQKWVVALHRRVTHIERCQVVLIYKEKLVTSL